MKPPPPYLSVIVVVLSGLTACSSSKEAERADIVVDHGLALLQNFVDTDIDLVLRALAQANAEDGGVGGSTASNSDLVDIGASLKITVADWREEAISLRSNRKTTGLRILLLERAQMLSSTACRWIRAVTETGAFAHHPSSERDEQILDYLKKMIETHEAFQDVAGARILELAESLSR